MTVRILVGGALAVLQTLPSESVHCCVTSPPYWKLRDYGVVGQIGLEPTIGEYLARMVLVFREIRRVLRADGTAWVNMGDSYAGSRCGGGTGGSTLGGSQVSQDQSKAAKRAMTDSRRRDNEPVPRSDIKQPGLKPKDLCGVPWRLAFALQDDGWWLRQDIVWSKKNPMPESVTDRCTKSHEYVFLLSKSERYYYDAEAIKEPVSLDTHARYARGRSGTHKNADGGPGNQTIAKGFENMRADGQIRKQVAGWATGAKDHSAVGHARQVAGRDGKLLNKAAAQNNGVGFGHGADRSGRMGSGPGWRVHKALPETQAKLAAFRDAGRVKNNASFDAAMAIMPVRRNRRSVWTIATEPFKGAHFATFPTALVEPCILAGSPRGGVVLDPFGGAGTTALVAERLQRDSVLIELNPDYAAMARQRIRDEAPLLTLEVA